MSVVRPLERGDLQSVANLLVRVFQGRQSAATGDMVAYLARFLLDFPDKHPQINSLVHEAAPGRINGFIGVATQLMHIDGRQLRAATANSLAVAPDANDPMVGARLCRGFFHGPQDISISDRSNAVSMAMWRGMGGMSLPNYSMDWLRVLRPLGSATATIRNHLRLLSATGPLTAGLDALLANYARRRGRDKWDLPVMPTRPPGLQRHDADDAELLAAIPQLVSASSLHPVWSEAALQALLTDAATKREFGPPIRQLVRDRANRVIGAYLYYLRPHGVAQVLHVLAARGMTAPVLDVLLADAAERGAVAIGGRAQAALIEPLMDRHANFSSPYRCFFHTTDAPALAAVQRGDAVLGGLVGEFWTRLNGDHLQ